jgi:hypothetical protein
VFTPEETLAWAIAAQRALEMEVDARAGLESMPLLAVDGANAIAPLEIDDLPSEMLTIIVGHLDSPVDVVNFSRVNTAWSYNDSTPATNPVVGAMLWC